MTKSVVIIGATSSLARALAHQLARRGTDLYLVARDEAELKRIAQDLKIRYQVAVNWSQFEALAFESHGEICDRILAQASPLDGVIICMGELGNQPTAQTDINRALAIIQSNYTGAVSVLTPLANALEKQGSGWIVGIGSVAGDRGRQSNYVYGSAKGALALFLQGLRSRLSKVGVHVMTVKPGFMDTKMTFGLPGLFLVADPNDVAEDILTALKMRKNTVYLPWFWWGIMMIIRSIPEPIFKKMKL
ncbi:SDR family oxidoreductase [Spirulina major]|uniref:SDR family oxidoreductase n=1 Tax=Spirulina major TaxID=270636 RepID=UPI0009344314|nr:SDR family oxidoreductase [Spirulina major]